MRSRSNPSTRPCLPPRSRPTPSASARSCSSAAPASPNDLQRVTGLTRAETAHALWELATAGLAAADGFDQLRALMDPRRKPTTTDTPGKRPTRTTAGRWSC
jgi:hypothetical protein